MWQGAAGCPICRCWWLTVNARVFSWQSLFGCCSLWLWASFWRGRLVWPIWECDMRNHHRFGPPFPCHRYQCQMLHRWEEKDWEQSSRRGRSLTKKIKPTKLTSWCKIIAQNRHWYSCCWQCWCAAKQLNHHRWDSSRTEWTSVPSRGCEQKTNFREQLVWLACGKEWRRCQ